MNLTIGKKKQGNAISKGAKIGAAIGGTTGAVSGAAGGRLAASMMGMGAKGKLASTIAGGLVGGATRAAVGGALGAGVGAGVKAVKNRKKAKFSNTELDTFADPVFIASFPKQELETKTTKSAIELAQEKLKLKDDFSSLLDNIYRT